MYWFMKKEFQCGFEEMDNLRPYEFEIYYFMAIKDFKIEHQQK